MDFPLKQYAQLTPGQNFAIITRTSALCECEGEEEKWGVMCYPFSFCWVCSDVSVFFPRKP